MKKKLCVVKQVSLEYLQFISDVDYQLCYKDDENYIRITEVVEVDFPDIDKIELLNAELAALDTQATKIKAVAEAAITGIERKRQELLAITHDT
ncbi:MAG: hypothetical protein COA94_04910 [Rickettsiales bacterium]|nr:MAG: hypothetical protein COA94_04910 [Rickettsiales bacterium]